MVWKAYEKKENLYVAQKGTHYSHHVNRLILVVTIGSLQRVYVYNENLRFPLKNIT